MKCEIKMTFLLKVLKTQFAQCGLKFIFPKGFLTIPRLNTRIQYNKNRLNTKKIQANTFSFLYYTLFVNNHLKDNIQLKCEIKHLDG